MDTSDVIEGRTALVVAPWLPTPKAPYAGSFVIDFARYLGGLYSDPPVLLHLDDSYRAESKLSTWIASRFVGQGLSAWKNTRPRTFHVPIPVPPGSGWVERALVARQMGRKLLESPLIASSKVDVHAHVGIVAGNVVHHWPGHSYRLFVYEHASFIVSLLRQERVANQLYGDTVARAEGVLCVNPVLAEQLKELYPSHAAKIAFHPNAVDFDRFGLTTREVPLRRWLYIGNLKPSKGSRRLIDAFHHASRRWNDLTLTLVGSGSDLSWISDRSLGPRVQCLRPVAPWLIPSLLAESDLLVHLSDGETFGLTAVEAIASGMPVIVTSTDGSELVIRPVIDQAGVILPAGAGDEEVVAAYAELRDMPDRLDLQSARRRLASAYGYPSVAGRLSSILSGSKMPAG